MVLKGYVTFEEELKKNPELKVADVDQLREWLKKQPHLPEIMDHVLALFLHRNSYRIEPTKVNIEKYFSLKTHIPELFSNRDPMGNRTLRQAFSIMTITPMAKSTREGYKVITCRLIDSDASKFNFNDYLKYMCMVFDELIYHNGTMKGYIFLVDTGPVTMGHAGRISPVAAKNILSYVPEALPYQLKGLHFINTNAITEVILSVLKPFMKKEILDILYIHPNLKSLDKYVPLEIIPNELGGKAGSYIELHDAEIKKLEDLRDYFLEEETRARVDESKRIEKRNMSLEFSGYDGFEGNFKKLDFD